MVGGDGTTPREHIELARQQAKKLLEQGVTLSPQLQQLIDEEEEVDTDTIVPPYELEHLLVAFYELHGTRQSGGFGPSPISYQEIESWERKRCFPLSAFEVDIVKKLDCMWLTHASKQAKSNSKAKGKN